MPDVNDLAPDFSLPSTSGKTVSLKDLRGKKVVLYFYPKDDTPGCTTEACEFRDNLVRLKSRSAVVLGVSKDSMPSHSKFRAKYELPFDLLSDEGNATAKAYGAYGQKLMYGKQVEGTIRTTFLIDDKGKIVAKWSPVKVEGHVAEVLAALNALNEPVGLMTPKKAAPKAVKVVEAKPEEVKPAKASVEVKKTPAAKKK